MDTKLWKASYYGIAFLVRDGSGGGVWGVGLRGKEERGFSSESVYCGVRTLLDRSSESFGRFADYESPACKADMAEGSAEEEQSSTAAPASPPADLRTLNTQLSPPYHHQPHLQPPRLQHLQHPNMLATAVPPRHSHSMLSHQVKTEAELDASYDVPLNLKSEVSFDESTTKLSTLLV